MSCLRRGKEMGGDPYLFLEASWGWRSRPSVSSVVMRLERLAIVEKPSEMIWAEHFGSVLE